MSDAFPVILAFIAVGIAAYLLSRNKKRLEAYRRELEKSGEPVAPMPDKGLSMADTRVQRFRAAHPMPDSTPVLEIAKQEAAELGIDRVTGSEDLPVGVQLIVWRRDEDIRNRCDGDLRFVVAEGIHPPDATVDQVQLACDGRLRPAPEAAPPDGATHTTESAEPDDAGNNSDV